MYTSFYRRADFYLQLYTTYTIYTIYTNPFSTNLYSFASIV